MKGNFHVRFLGGPERATAQVYPVMASAIQNSHAIACRGPETTDFRDRLITSAEEPDSRGYLSRNGSIDALTTRDQIDVGISGPLQTSFGFFDPLIAASPGLALRLACLGPAKAGMTGGFSTFHMNHKDGLGPLYTPAVQYSRRTIRQSPNLTAYLFGPSLEQPRVACCD